MLQVQQVDERLSGRQSYDHMLGTAMLLAWRANALARRGLHRVQLRSRRGEGNAIWTMLVVGLVAVVAAVALFPIGQRMIEMGQEAAANLQQPPW